MLGLKIGTELQSSNNKKIVVKKLLGQGGQGFVYKVEYDGKPMALKWYFKSKLHNIKEFENNLKINIEKGKPNNSFLWPIDIVKDKTNSGSLGYIMELRPDGYNELADFLVMKAKFKNNLAEINAALDICCAFRALHLKGLSYQDLNDGNFFINGETGRVLICDNDNVAPDGDNTTGIRGKARYMAPEVVSGKSTPNTQSDKFSLAVVLFILLYRNHPLEGCKTLVPCMTEKHELKFYGENPIFIYDPNITTNRPAKGVHDNAIRIWNYYPKFIKDMFIKSFSQDLIKNPDKRIIEREWADTFIKLRDSLVNCPFCDDEFFADTKTNQVVCANCGKTINRPGIIQCGQYAIPIFVGNKLYKCHSEGLADEDIDCFKEIGQIILGKSKVEGKPPFVCLKNLSDLTWHTLDEKNKEIPTNGIVRIIRGLEIDLGGSYKTAKII